jgi:hypothetical protein
MAWRSIDADQSIHGSVGKGQSYTQDNRAHISQTDTRHRRNRFNSILLYSDVRSEKCLISAYSGPACSLLSSCQVLYEQQQLADPFITFTISSQPLCQMPSYNVGTIDQAVSDVRTGRCRSARQSALHHSIPPSTLRDCLSERASM